MEKSKTVCFSGYRMEEMPMYGDRDAPKVRRIKERLQQAILDAIAEGFTHFICGMTDGWDTWAYDTVAVIRGFRGDEITLEAAIPYSRKLKGKEKRIEDAQLSYADTVIVLSERYYKGVYHARNRYIVDNSNLLICYYDGKSGGTQYTVKYAREKGIRIVNIAK